MDWHVYPMGMDPPDVDEMRDRISSLEAQTEALEAALRPFATLCTWLDDEYAGPADCDDADVLLVTDWEVPSEDRDEVTAGMILAARAVLREPGAGASTDGEEEK